MAQLECLALTVQKFIDEGQLTGAVTIVARLGKIAHFAAYGMMNIEANTPMQKDIIFCIYSMSKPVAAVAVMMLCVEGKLQFDAPASVYLAELGGLKTA